MSMHRPAVVIGVVALVAAVVTACAPAPNRDEVAERFKVELDAASGLDLPQEIADGLADDALDGKCGSDAYRIGLSSQDMLISAWDATCLMYFESDMSASQVERAKQTIIDDAVNR